MQRRAQASERDLIRASARGGRPTLGFLLCLALAGCGSAGTDLERYAADHTLTTGSVVAESEPLMSDELASDKMVIRDAVSIAATDGTEDDGRSWTNARTGSSGTITALAEMREDDGTICRHFTTTRDSFDGIGLYRGEVCRRRAAEIWWMRSFESL